MQCFRGHFDGKWSELRTALEHTGPLFILPGGGFRSQSDNACEFPVRIIKLDADDFLAVEFKASRPCLASVAAAAQSHLRRLTKEGRAAATFTPVGGRKAAREKHCLIAHSCS